MFELKKPPARSRKTPQITVRLKPAVMAFINDAAQQTGISRNEVISQLLEQRIADCKPTKDEQQ